MNVDEHEQRHLDSLMSMEKPDTFGCSFVQRHIKIGYNSACYVLERGVRTGVLKPVENTPQYRVVKAEGKEA